MACSGAFLQACVAGGAMYLGGQGGAEDKAKAKTYFEKACDGKNADGCFNLGVLYGSGNGVTKDIDKSQQFFQKGCDLGNKKSCETLEQLKADIEKAKAPQPKAKGKK
jgi:TPR repeat protein